MAIVRGIREREKPYFVMIKKPLGDKGLSWKAKGLLSYLLSKPDDWKTYIEQLVKESSDGRASVRAGIKELIDAVYIVRGDRVRGERGFLQEYEYFVFEEPSKPAKPDER